MERKGTYRLGTIAAVALAVELVAWPAMLAGWWLLKNEVPGFRFERPQLLWGMLAGPVMLGLLLLDTAWRNRTLVRFAADATRTRAVPGISTARMLLRYLLLRSAVVPLVAALAGPQYGTRYEEVKAHGVDVVVAIDVSNSMACQDVKPSRLEAARHLVSQLIDRMPGDRIGLVVFAGEAFTQLPLTTDRSAARMFLSTISTSSVSLQGTAIGRAVDLAVHNLGEQGAGRAIVVVSDGEEHEEGAEDAVRRARELGITVHTVGMGTPQGGPLPIRRGGQLLGFRKDRDGNTVVSRMNEGMLRALAEAGGGTYTSALHGARGMAALAETLHGMEQGDRGTYRFASYAEQFHIPLGLALLLTIAAMVLGDRRQATLQRTLAVAAPALVLGACGSGAAHRAELALRQGNAHYHAGRYPEAAEAYAQAHMDHRAVFNHGNAAYRAGDRATAVDRFTAHLAMVPDSLKASTYFNLGDARAMQARAADSLGRARLQEAASVKLEGDVAQRVSQYVQRDSLQREARRLLLLTDSALNESAKAFKACLRANPADEEARYNLAQVMRLIAARPGHGRNDPGGGQDEKALGEVARLLLSRADTLVEQHRFREALDLLKRGLNQDPTLQQRKDYMDKLETVTKAAEAA